MFLTSCFFSKIIVNKTHNTRLIIFVSSSKSKKNFSYQPHLAKKCSIVTSKEKVSRGITESELLNTYIIFDLNEIFMITSPHFDFSGNDNKNLIGRTRI